MYAQKNTGLQGGTLSGPRMTTGFGPFELPNVVLVERLEGLFFNGRHSCTEDCFVGRLGLYFDNFLTVVCVRRGWGALNGSMLLLVTAYLS